MDQHWRKDLHTRWSALRQDLGARWHVLREAVWPHARLIRVIAMKEALETVRDRRTIIVALLLPVVMMPVVTLGIPYLAQRQQRERAKAPAVVAVVNRTAGSDLIALGEKRGLIKAVTVSQPKEALLARRVDAVVEIPKNFRTALARGTAAVTVLYDEGNADSVLARQRIADLVAAYAAGRAEARLRSRGLSRAALEPVTVRARNVADERRLGGVLLASLLPFFISVWAVLGGQYAALDLGAGEKERRTLEALLVSPPSRWHIAGGKFLTVLLASLAAVVMVIATTLITLRLGAHWGLAELRRAAVVISLGPAILLFLTACVLVAFLSALQLALSIFARGVREAQQYFTPVYLLLSLPALAAPFLEGWGRVGWTYLIPGLNAVFVFRNLLLGTASGWHLVLTLASTGLYTILALGLAVYLLHQEPVIMRA